MTVIDRLEHQLDHLADQLKDHLPDHLPDRVGELVDRVPTHLPVQLGSIHRHRRSPLRTGVMVAGAVAAIALLAAVVYVARHRASGDAHDAGTESSGPAGSTTADAAGASRDPRAGDGSSNGTRLVEA